MKKITILLICSFSMFAALKTQASDFYRAKEGLDYILKDAKAMVGDSAQLYRIVSHRDRPITYNPDGLSPDWCYTFCNKDTCLKFAVYLDHAIFSNQIVSADKYEYYTNPIPIDSIGFYSDSIKTLKCQSFYKLCSEYRLDFTPDSPFDKPTWQFVFLSGGDAALGLIHAPGDEHLQIDAITGECFLWGTSVESESDELSNIILSPNPATDFIEIDMRRWAPLAKWSPSEGIRIFNVFGQIVLSVGVQNFEPLRINVTSLTTGMYFVRIGDRVGKFVKM